MIYESSTLSARYLEDGIAELRFDAKEGSVNKFDAATLTSFAEAMAALKAETELKGLLVTSGKDAFLVGADITEFLGHFAAPAEQLNDWLTQINGTFNALEDIDCPTVVAVKGFALGGGCEAILCGDYRIADTTAVIGLPETKLGIMPGWGGTVRLPRLIGTDNALEWITTGANHKADKALKTGAVDAVVAPEKLNDAAMRMLKDAIAGKFDWKARRAQKKAPIGLSPIETMMSFTTAKGMVAAKAGKHYPAPMTAVKCIEASAALTRDDALPIETKGFVKLAKTDVAQALVGIFLGDQYVKGKAKKAAKAGQPVKQAAVLGAGIMGGGIAYQSASKGTPIVMKDINQAALELGLNEAAKLLDKQLSRGRIDGKKMAKVLNNITPSLDYAAVKDADVVVEAVVENPKVKGMVLAEVEGVVREDAIVTSNTSTISINALAKNLKRPEQFCGMHFFNPVHRMPLVEVIRGEQTSDETVAAVVAYAAKMGKSPIVVNDCPGFFVNRVLFPYFGGFAKLLSDGADYVAIDKVMEKEFGWPMGPAYLLDVVGMDTAHHAQAVMAEGFPERMAKSGKDAIDAMYEADRYGQKNGKGFYSYGVDKRGKPKKEVDADAQALVAGVSSDSQTFTSEEIIARTMLPMIIETVRCLEEGIIGSAAEADMGLVYGLGFPPFRGGVFRYIDTVGIDKIVALADSYADLGPMYQVTQGMRDMAANGNKYLA